MKESLKNKAIQIRKTGYSYSYIKNKLGVSKSTLSDWLSEIPYEPNKETLAKIDKARILANQARRNQKEDSLKEAKKLALKDIGKFSKRDLFLLGIGLYIGEGSKTNNIVRIVNSDPRIIKTSIVWFKKILHLQNDNFSIRIHLYPDSDSQEARQFWLKETGLSPNCFLRDVVDTRTNKKRKNKGKLPYGTAHISIKGNGNKKLGSFLFRRISSWIEIVHQKAGVV